MIALLLGAVCIGFAPVLVRLSDVGPVASAFWRTALAAPVLWLLVAVAARRVAGAAAAKPPAASTDATTAPPAVRLWSAAVLLSGLFFAADLATWHVSIQLTTVANATLLANCAVLLATLHAVLIQRRIPPPLYFVALTLAVGGALALTAPRAGSAGHWRGDLLALLAAVLYTGYLVTVKHASRRHGTLPLMAASTTITAVALAPLALLLSLRAHQPFWPAQPHGWWVLLALALLTQVAGQGLIARALARLSVTLSTTGLLLQPVVAAAVAWGLFGESLRAAQIAGAVALMLGIWLARRSEA